MLALILRSDHYGIFCEMRSVYIVAQRASYGATNSVVELVGGDMGSSEGHSYYWWEGSANK